MADISRKFYASLITTGLYPSPMGVAGSSPAAQGTTAAGAAVVPAAGREAMDGSIFPACRAAQADPHAVAPPSP